jgi:hypothetical protein
MPTVNVVGEELKNVVVKAKLSDVVIPVFGLLWIPYRKTDNGRLELAWRQD